MALLRVAVYTRISDDDEGKGLGVKRQADDCRALAKLRGWQVAYVACDNSVSAFKTNIIRPEFERMMADLEAGLVDGIVAYDLDRFARQPTDLERAIKLYDKRPGVFATVQGDIDLGSADGRTMARIMVAFANKSSMDMSRRQSRKQRQLAELGMYGGGGKRAYGFDDDRVTVRPTEAKIIQEAAYRVLAGESLTSICRGFNERGVPATGSAPWRRNTLRGLLLTPRIAGLRIYRGALVLGADGQPVKARWEPIIDPQTWEAVRELLVDPARAINRGRDSKYLLSGFLRCPCSSKMFGVSIRGARKYRCHQDWGCGRTVRMATPLDEHITELVLRYLERQELEPVDEISAEEDVIDRQITEAERSLAALINEWNEGRMSDAVFFAAQAKKEASLTALRRQRAKRRQIHAPVGPGVRQIWESANLSQRRAILSEVLVGVKVLPKPNSAPKKFLAEYYVPLWKTDD
jgi:site-specific DNA recombinase